MFSIRRAGGGWQSARERTRRRARRPALTVLSALLALGVALLAGAPARAAGVVPPRIELEVLLLGTSSTQSDLQDWQAALTREGIPYREILTAGVHTPITSATLSGTTADGTRVGHYEAVIVANQGLLTCSSGPCVSTLTQPEWDAIEQYERDFSVRQITGDVSPGSNSTPGPVYGTGMNAPVYSGTLDGVPASLTSAGQAVFSYLQPTAPITFGVVGAATPGSTTWGHEATPLSTTSFNTLLAGPGGTAFVGVYTHPDGVQELEQTYASNQYLLQDQLLRHGELVWVTRGVYLGDQRNYSETEIDDTMIGDDVWDPITHQVDTNPADAVQESASDLTYAAQWSLANHFRIDMVFNGSGGAGSTNGPSLLTQLQAINPQTARPYLDSFGWVNHTWDHPNIDQGCASSDYIQAEVNQNTNWATTTLGLSTGTGALGQIDPTVLVTGEHSGLANLVPGTPGTVDPPLISELTPGHGSLPAGTYTYAVSDQFSATGGESTASSAQITLSSPGAVTLSWDAVCHAADYRVYRQDNATGVWTLLSTVNATAADFGPTTGSTTDVTGQGAQPLAFTDTGTVTGTPSSGPPAGNTATEIPYQQNLNFAGALAALGITAFGADASKPYPSPADATAGFGGTTFTGASVPAGSTFQQPGTGSWAVPRYPTNIYYNAATQAQELDEFNTIYFTSPAADFSAVVDNVVNFGAGSMFAHLMGNDPRPSYFHQSNLVGGPAALYYSVMARLLEEYYSYFNVPVAQPTLGESAALLREQASWAADQAAASPTVGAYIQGSTVTVTNSGSTVAMVPLTGIPGLGSAYGSTASGWVAAPATGTAASYAAATSWPPARVIGLTLSPASVTADGQSASTATVTLSSGDGFPISGEPPALSASDPAVVIGPVTDAGDGSYTASITSSTNLGPVMISASDPLLGDGVAAAAATLTQVAGSAANMTLTLSGATLAADGSSGLIATARVSDGAGHALGAQQVSFATSDPGVRLGPVVDNGDGSYSVALTASGTAGLVTVTATDSSVSPALSAQASFSQTALPGETVTPDQPGAPGTTVTPDQPGGPGTTVTPGQPGVVLRSPVVGTGSGPLSLSGGRVTVRLSCPAAQSGCSGTLTLTLTGSRPASTLASAHFDIPGGTSRSVVLRLSAAALRRVGNAASTRVQLTARAVNPAGVSGVSSRATTLRQALDRVRPRVAIGAGPLKLSAGRIAVTLSCPTDQSRCEGTATLRQVGLSRELPLLATRSYRIDGGHGLVLTLSPSRAVLAAAAGRHSLNVQVRVSARNRRGLRATSTRTLQLQLSGGAGAAAAR